MRYCKDIGMYVIDRSIAASCVHRTPFCAERCFNRKLECAFHISQADERLESEWKALDGVSFRALLKRRTKHQTTKVRLCSRGEAFSTYEDLCKVANILYLNPNTKLWIPTRAWRAPALKVELEKFKVTYPNAVIMASIDPSNTPKEIASLKSSGWQFTFFGDNNKAPEGVQWFKCPKTWNKLKGFCPKCNGGCFGGSNVWLKEH